MNNDQRIIEELSILRKEIDRLKRVEVPVMPIIPVVTEWQAWTPTSVVGWSTRANENYRYCLIGKTCYFAFRVTGTSNSSATNFKLPFKSKAIAPTFFWNGAVGGQNNGIALATSGRWSIETDKDTLHVWRDWSANTGWTNSGIKLIYATGFYEIE